MTPLPEGACLLHIGPYKTGSSAIQASLHHRRRELIEHGVLYPGEGVRAMRAGWAVIGVTPRGRPPAAASEWQALVDEVRGAPERRVCVSTEDLARVGPNVADRVVTDLGTERVHVLTVVRRLDRLLPSQWQQRAQSFKTESFEDFLHAVLDTEPPVLSATTQAFWASHDVSRVLTTWSRLVEPERVIAVVADEHDRTLLPRSFEQLLGLPTGLLQEEATVNPSLSFNAVEVLRRLNAVAAERGWPEDEYSRLVRNMARAVKAAPRPAQDIAVPTVPSWAEDRLLELSAQRVEAVRRAGVRVIGDVESLVTVTCAPSVSVDGVAIETVVNALQGVVRTYHAKRERVRAREASAPQATASLSDAGARQIAGELAARAGGSTTMQALRLRGRSRES